MADKPVSQTIFGDTASMSIVQSVDAAEHAGCFSGWNLPGAMSRAGKG